MNNPWPAEAYEELQRYYGIVDTKALCKRLGVSYSRLRRKVKSCGLGPQREYDELITVRQLRAMMNIQHYAVQRFIRAGLPVRKMKFGIGERYNIMVSLDDLLVWLEAHQDMWNASKIEYMALGCEPEWLKQKRKEDIAQSRWGYVLGNGK